MAHERLIRRGPLQAPVLAIVRLIAPDHRLIVIEEAQHPRLRQAAVGEHRGRERSTGGFPVDRSFAGHSWIPSAQAVVGTSSTARAGSVAALRARRLFSSSHTIATSSRSRAMNTSMNGPPDPADRSIVSP